MTDPARTVQRTYLAPDPPHDARGVVHLGHQHAVPARCRPDQHRGLRGQRVLHGRPGPLRGPDRRRRRHPRPSLLVPAGRGDPARLDPPLPGDVADPRAASRLGGRVDPARPRVHVLLGRDRGVARRCARGDRLHAAASSRSSAGPRRSAARRCSCGSVLGGVIAQADQPRRARTSLRAAMLGVTLVVALLVHARHRVHAEPRRETRSPRSAGPARVDRRRLAQPAGALADARRAVHGRRRLLRVLRAPAVPPRAVRRPDRVRRRRPRRRDRGRRPDRRRADRAAGAPPLPAPDRCPDRSARVATSSSCAHRPDHQLRRSRSSCSSSGRWSSPSRGRSARRSQRGDPVGAARDGAVVRQPDGLDRRRDRPAGPRPGRRRLRLRRVVRRRGRRPGAGDPVPRPRPPREGRLRPDHRDHRPGSPGVGSPSWPLRRSHPTRHTMLDG